MSPDNGTYPHHSYWARKLVYTDKLSMGQIDYVVTCPCGFEVRCGDDQVLAVHRGQRHCRETVQG
jgi:hypothetical protein